MVRTEVSSYSGNRNSNSNTFGTFNNSYNDVGHRSHCSVLVRQRSVAPHKYSATSMEESVSSCKPNIHRRAFHDPVG